MSGRPTTGDVQLDRRWRYRRDVVDVDPSVWIASELPRLCAQRGSRAAHDAIRLGLRPIHLRVGSLDVGIRAIDGGLLVGEPADDAATLNLTEAGFSDWINWLVTLEKLSVSGDARFDPADRWAIGGWQLIVRWLTDGVPVHEPGTVQFRDRRGDPLDLTRSFTPFDDPDDIAHFLREAGYLHLCGWLNGFDMDDIAREMEQAAPSYRHDDGRSWWATLAGGERVCVRMRYFVEHSPTTAALLASPQWDAVRRVIAGNETLLEPVVADNVIEALFKPLDVVAGISDVPWHRDCTFGGHPYDCGGVVVGISVTDGTADSGLLRVVAGSHRAATVDDPAWRGNDLPVVALPTRAGDLTVHINCTVHEALPPRVAPRKVMYTGFGIPPQEPVVAVGALTPRDLRNEAYLLTSQPDNTTRGADPLSP